MALVRWLGSRRRRTSPTAGERKQKGRDRHEDCCENRCDSNSLLTKQGTNALIQYGVFMEEPPECLTDSVDLRLEGCSVRGEGFEPCLSFKLDVRDYTLEPSDSVSNLSLHFSVVCFRQFLMLPGEVSFDLGFSVVDTRQLCQVVCSHSRHCLSDPSQLSSALGDPTRCRLADHQSSSKLIMRFDVRCRLCREGYQVRLLSVLLGRVLSVRWSAITAELLRPFRV